MDVSKFYGMWMKDELIFLVMPILTLIKEERNLKIHLNKQLLQQSHLIINVAEIKIKTNHFQVIVK